LLLLLLFVLPAVVLIFVLCYVVYFFLYIYVFMLYMCSFAGCMIRICAVKPAGKQLLKCAQLLTLLLLLMVLTGTYKKTTNNPLNG